MKSLIKPMLGASVLYLALAVLPLGAAEVEALVRTVRGNATAEINGSTKSLAVGDTIPSGAIVSTGKNGEIDFAPVPGTTLRLEGSSKLTIEKLDLKTSGNSARKTAHMRLIEGVVMADIQRQDNEVIDLRIKNDAGTAIAKGTGLRLTQTILLVGRGVVQFVFNDGAEYLVNLNQLLQFAAREQGAQDVPPVLVDNTLLEAFLARFGKPIEELNIDNQQVLIVFADGTTQLVDLSEALALQPTNLFGALFALLQDPTGLQDILNDLPDLTDVANDPGGSGGPIINVSDPPPTTDTGDDDTTTTDDGDDDGPGPGPGGPTTDGDGDVDSEGDGGGKSPTRPSSDSDGSEDFFGDFSL